MEPTMTRHYLLAAAIVALSASHAPAQTSGAGPTTLDASGGVFLQQDDRTHWRASKLIGVGVNGPDDSKIGKIDDILFDSTGNVRAVVVRMGEDDKTVAMPFTSLTISRSTSGDSVDKVSVTYRKDDLQKAPSFKWAESSTKTGSPN
jgi:hypothetical protein